MALLQSVVQYLIYEHRELRTFLLHILIEVPVVLVWHYVTIQILQCLFDFYVAY